MGRMPPRETGEGKAGSIFGKEETCMTSSQSLLLPKRSGGKERDGKKGDKRLVAGGWEVENSTLSTEKFTPESFSFVPKSSNSLSPKTGACILIKTGGEEGRGGGSEAAPPAELDFYSESERTAEFFSPLFQGNNFGPHIHSRRRRPPSLLSFLCVVCLIHKHISKPSPPPLRGRSIGGREKERLIFAKLFSLFLPRWCRRRVLRRRQQQRKTRKGNPRFLDS